MKKVYLLLLMVFALQILSSCNQTTTNKNNKSQVEQSHDCCGDDDIDVDPEDIG